VESFSEPLPLRRFEFVRTLHGRVASIRADTHGVRGSSEFYVRARWDPSGSIPTALTRPFPAGLAVSLLAVPRPFRAEVHPPSSFSTPSAFRSIACPPYRFELRSFDLHPDGLRAPSVGFLPSSRLQSIAALARVPMPHAKVLLRVTPVGTCPLGPSVLGVSRALDVSFRNRPCGLISSRCRVQVFSFRGLSLVASPFRISPAVSPPVVGRPGLRFPAPARSPSPSGVFSSLRVR